MTIDQQQEWARIAQERVAARLAAQPGQQDPAPTAEPEWTAEDEQDDPEPEGVFPDPDPALADTMPVILLPQEDFDTVWHAPHMKFDHAAAVTTSSTTDATAAVVSAEPAALHPEPLHLPNRRSAFSNRPRTRLGTVSPSLGHMLGTTTDARRRNGDHTTAS